MSPDYSRYIPFTVQVSAPANRPPVITSTPVAAATVGQLYSYDVDATDPDVGGCVDLFAVCRPHGHDDCSHHRAHCLDARRQSVRRTEM